MNRIIFSSSESFNGKDTWISQKSPHRGIKKMFYSFMMQTLSYVQILSFHCLCYLKEEQTAGSSLDASIEDFFYFIIFSLSPFFFFPCRKMLTYLYGKEPGNSSYSPCLTHAKGRINPALESAVVRATSFSDILGFFLISLVFQVLEQGTVRTKHCPQKAAHDQGFSSDNLLFRMGHYCVFSHGFCDTAPCKITEVNYLIFL